MEKTFSPKLSIVIPIYNEAESVGELHRQTLNVLEQCNLSGEIVFVDDGSEDATFQKLEEIYEGQRPDGRCRTKVIRFRRNFGKAAALTAGFEATTGDVVITVDGDLQDDPQEIPRFLEKLDEGFDLVSGWKKKRRDPITKTIPSKIFNKVVSLLSGVKIHDFNCGFKAYRAELAHELLLHGELHRYIPVLAHAKGYRIAEIIVAHRPRAHGRSKYGWARLLWGFLDLHTVMLLTKYSSRPLHFFGMTGVLGFVAGLIINAYLTVLWFQGHRPIGDRPLLMLGILLMILGIQLISVGLIGEMVLNAHEPLRKNYSILKKLD